MVAIPAPAGHRARRRESRGRACSRRSGAMTYRRHSRASGILCDPEGISRARAPDRADRQHSGESLAHEVAAAYQELGRRGFVPGSAGNVSARTRTGLLITPSGCSADSITASSIVAARLDGTPIGAGIPSSEWPMHAAIYRTYPQAGAIVHTHADACTALACLNQHLPAFHYMITIFGGDDVRCAAYVTFGTPELAAVAVAALDGRTACLLANHGMVVYADTVGSALTNAIVLESLCRQYLMGSAAGTLRLLTIAEIQDARERFKIYGPGRLGQNLTPNRPLSSRQA